ncbi:hypothetical protein SAMN05444008_1088 [Cnuella takakiae]|uniref:WD40-like Beta Propeller Repeat n=1 Tax=Cnuella takakiae TaxID=1302690 RepID=A0A1M5BN19_9BACT|nr:hypothetical protein [Cnuella takakiae]SHF43800.1 hypothetical protein SAMN05444008_1088 [Cnuella takakiae]
MVRLTLALLLICTQSFAQQFGGFSPYTRWQQINTDTARIIFQAPSEALAQRVATLVHRMAATKPTALGNRLQKINIVLHNNTTLANGYVGLGPFRSEYYLIPGSDLFEQGAIPFHEQLAIHEYRHVQQYNNMYRGLTKAFRVVLGEEGQALANALTVPNWFFEGDAVHAETALTPQGRGRTPYFTSGPLSIWEAGRDYSLMKWMNGSLKDYVPNHYQFGYLLANFGYKTYGEDFWQKVIADASAFRRLPTPMRSAIKAHTGKSFRTFVADAFANYQQEAEVEKRSQPAGLVRNQYFPMAIGKDSLLYLEQTYRSLSRFMLQDAKGTHIINLRDISSENWLSYRNGTIAYTAYATDPRWNLTDYSNIVLLDIATRKERTLTRKARYFTPDLSPSGKKIVAVHVDSATRTRLHILNANTGALLQELVVGEGTFFFHPRFLDEDHIVVVHRRRNGSVALHQWDLQTGKQQILVYGGFNAMGYPFVQGKKVFFSASASGSDDVYAYDVTNDQLSRYTRASTGNYFVSVHGDSLLFSNFTVNGLRIQGFPVQGVPLSKEALAGVSPRFAVAGDSINLLQTETQRFATSRYAKGTGLLNLHSWRPFYEDPELSFTALSNNILNTLDASAFYRYNQNERSHAFGANLAYGGFYPVLTAGADYTFNRQLRTTRGTQVFQQWETRAGYTIPLNFTQGKTYKILRFGSSINFNRLMPQHKENPFLARNRTYLAHAISWSQYLPRARQHIFPKLGYTLSPSYRHQLGGNRYQWLASGQLYLPSWRNHSLVLSGAVQATDTALALFSNRFANARGYADYYLPRMWRVSANYHFPIAYPDWGFGGLVYLLRLRSNLYYDYSEVWQYNQADRRRLRSAGTELFFDLKLMNQLETSIGIRYSYLLDPGFSRGNRNVFAIILPTDLIPR